MGFVHTLETTMGCPTMSIQKFARIAPAIACSVALVGCAVRPEPLTFDQLNTITVSNTERVTLGQEPVHGAISLYEAMARALKYNLDARVEIMQTQLRTTELRLSHYNMLPNAVANSGYAGRDSYLSTGQKNLLTGVETPARTTSQEKTHTVSDLSFSWNILDFGLSYVRARQAADRVLIAEEARRKVVQKITEDTRTAYWRAVSSDRMLTKLKGLEARTRTALNNTRSLSAAKETSLITALTYERELVEIKRTAQELQRELSVAKTQLAALMNISPGAHFALSGAELTSKAPLLDLDPHDLTYAALLNRPELRDVSYQRRINEREAHAALLELLPGIQLYGGQNYDTNKYLDNKEWVNWGAKASWNLVRVFQYPAKRRVIGAQDELLDARALALTMAIMTQVHVSRMRYLNLTKELVTARDYFDVQTRLVKQMRAEAAADRISEQTLIREELNTLVAEAKRDIAFAAAQNAFGGVFAAVGLDPYSEGVALDASVGELTTQLKSVWFERGDFGANRKFNLALR
jgi:outer membrane protein TolC